MAGRSKVGRGSMGGRGRGGRNNVSNVTLSRDLSKFLFPPARLGDKTIGIHSLCLYAVQHFDFVSRCYFTSK